MAKKQFKPATREILQALLDKYSVLDDWSSESIHAVVKAVCEDKSVGFGKVGQPLRLALSGTGNAGAIDQVAELVGKQRTLMRLQMALDYIDQHSV